MNPAGGDIASLIESLAHSDRAVVRTAIDSLVTIGHERPEVRESLNRLLQEVSSEKRWPVAYTLGQLSQPSSSCLDTLMEALGSEDPDIRWATLQLLIRLGKNDKRILPLISDLLNSESPTQRRMAIYCLRDLGFEDRSVQLQCLGDTDPLVRVAAVIALSKQSRLSEDVLSVLVRLNANDTDSRVRNAAGFALERLGISPDKFSSK
ncbi:MAG: HEAT repeat domain-containing protein [Deltaproteobacteria bacterium]|nr:HEAT repeat domain-containing protein [Deltaproteobacteria bacterium]